MEAKPTRELLEATHQFPCTYMFKAIGKSEDGFAARVVAAVREELDACMDPPYKVLPTASGRHVSVTLEPTVTSVEQVLAVYERIRSMRGLVVLW